MRGFADCHLHIQVKDYPYLSSVLDDFSSFGVTDASLLALPYRSIGENLSVLYWKNTYHGIRLRAFGGLHQTDQLAEVPYLRQVQTLLQLGCDGIKLMDMCPENYAVNGKGLTHPSYAEMFAFLEESRTPVLIHANDPKVMWNAPDDSMHDGYSIYRGYYHGKAVPSFSRIHRECLELLDRYPHLNILFAHFLFLSDDLQEAGRILDTYPNVRFDLAPALDLFFNFQNGLDKWHDFFTKYRTRILFGTDSGAYSAPNAQTHELLCTFLSHDDTEFLMPGYSWRIRGLGLDEETLNRICFENYRDFVSDDIAPVDGDALRSHAEEILFLLRTRPECSYHDAAARMFPELAADAKQELAAQFLRFLTASR